MNKLQLKIINKSNNELPKYETAGASGMDLRAFLDKDVHIKPFERMLIPTGIYIELPEGYEAQIRPRSGLAVKNGISVLNAPGTIDYDFFGQIQVILINLSWDDFIVKNSDRIAQMVIAKCEQAICVVVDNFDKETGRNSEGFGSTGVK
jgi:dUTP pyrophosphatase